MRIALQPAFILHHRPYRETSAILELLTQDYGRISGVVRGARNTKSSIKALLQPFTPLYVSWQGKSELTTISAIEPQGVALRLQGHCLLSGFYLNELLIRILPKQDACPRLYTIYQKTLLELQQGKLQEKNLRIFEKSLLEELGYGLQLRSAMPDNQTILPDQYYRFVPEQGFEWVKEPFADNSIFSGKSILSFAEEQFTAENLHDAKRLMRMALAPLLGGKALHSRKLFLEVEVE